MTFPVSGVEIFPLWPPLAALAIAFFCSMGGVSGAFLLLPFQVSVLGFTSPAVTPTNMIYNPLAIPGGVYRYLVEGRMCWPLVLVNICGTIPGVFLGLYVRLTFLLDPKAFKLFVGLVLLYVGVRLVLNLAGRTAEGGIKTAAGPGPGIASAAGNPAGGNPRRFTAAPVRIQALGWDWPKLGYRFGGRDYSFNAPAFFFFSLAVGVVSGAYGIGGGSIIAPFLVSVFNLPVHTIAGATLAATHLTSIVGILIYTFIGPWLAGGSAVSPDWLLGALLGVGGLAGMYLGARTQKFMPARLIKGILAALVCFVALRYLAQSLGLHL